MAHRSADVGIVGAGPAGAHLAARLAASGFDVALFDPKGAWEKPCGGGVTTRALREFAFLLGDPAYPCTLVKRITVVSSLGRSVSVKLQEPFAIYSRQVLNGLLLDRAVAAGARFERESVQRFSRTDDGWIIQTGGEQTWRVRFLVGADGVTSSVRRKLIGIFPTRDIAMAMGYNVVASLRDGDSRQGGKPGSAKPRRDAECDTMLVRFPSGFAGYFWMFPRPGVMNFGVACKMGQLTSQRLRELLEDFMHGYYGGNTPDGHCRSFFAAKIPILDPASWRDLKVTGDGWALAGDAAGFVDPITGEGIYYALKSSELLADALASEADYNRATARYESSWPKEFGAELALASRLLPRFYNGRFIGHVFDDAMVLFARYHAGVRKVMTRAIIGEQSYAWLKRDLIKSILRIF